MKRALILLLCAAATLVTACATTAAVATPGSELRAQADADPKAREIAERVARSMGGWDAWERTRFVTWRFFGGRAHAWDKRTGEWRLDDGERTVLMDVGTRAGRVFEKGVEVTDAAGRAAALEKAYAVWVNDSYWVFMPWKLLDPGVVLRYLGATTLESGNTAQLLELTFEGVGLTPRNRYVVAVGDESGLVEQWSYFADANDAEPKFTLPWSGWERRGAILVCTDHGERNGTKPDWDIEVHAELPRAVFTDPAAAMP